MRLRNGTNIIDNEFIIYLEIYADMINADDNIIVRNCKVPVVNSHMRMSVDAFGKIEISKEIKIENVKLDKDFSLVAYDNLSDRKRFVQNQGNSYNNKRNDGSRHYNKDNYSEFSHSHNDTQSVSTFLSSKL